MCSNSFHETNCILNDFENRPENLTKNCDPSLPFDTFAFFPEKKQYFQYNLSELQIK